VFFMPACRPAHGEPEFAGFSLSLHGASADEAGMRRIAA
jgi:hypothetical protein